MFLQKNFRSCNYQILWFLLTAVKNKVPERFLLQFKVSVNFRTCILLWCILCLQRIAINIFASLMFFPECQRITAMAERSFRRNVMFDDILCEAPRISQTAI